MSTDVAPYPRIRPRPEFARILKADDAFARHRDSEDAAERINGWFDRLMVQSGLNTSPVVLLLLCIVSALAFGGAAFVIQENLLLAGLMAAIGAAVPVFSAMIKRTRRQTQIMKQLPETIAELARAARTGRSLEQCFQMIAEDTGGPLGDELKLCNRRLQMGLDISAALRDLPDRTGVVSISVLVMALTVHQQTGGDLVAVLDRLSRTIRDRLMFLGRLRAQTIASRATAVLMIALPPLIFAFFMFRDPEYFQRLTQSGWGRGTLISAICLQVIGSAWVLRIMKHSRRT